VAGGVDVRIEGLKAIRGRFNERRKVEVTNALRQRLTDAWRSGGEAFIRAAIRRVLVDTGMSAATFFPLSRAIAKVKAEAAIEAHIVRNQKRVARKGIPTFPSGKRRPGFQGIDEGERLGKQAYIFNVPKPGSRVIVFRFSFQTVAFQHAINENMQRSLLAGIEAFRERIQIRFERDAEFVVSEFLRGRIVRRQGIE